MVELVGTLTAQQVACLRLVYARRTTKEVAAELGISLSTVEFHLKNARERLGATSSMQAAIRCFEGGHAYGSSTGRESTVPPRTAGGDAGVEPELGRSLGEERVAYQADAPSWAGIEWPVPTGGRTRHAMNVWTKLFWIFVLTTLLMMLLWVLKTLFAP
jgi:DNA-binding CsgD family transcriptional regulator